MGTLGWRDKLNVGHQSYGCERAKEFSTSPQTDNWGKIRDWRNGIRGALKMHLVIVRIYHPVHIVFSVNDVQNNG